VVIPTTLALIVLAGPILTTFIQYGEYTAADTRMSQLSFIAYGSGLPAFVLIKVLAPGFYARQDTRTPMRVGIIAMLTNMALNVTIVFPWAYFGIPGPHAGLATGTTLAAYLNATLLYRKLHRTNVYRAHAGWRNLALKVSAATVFMAIVLWAVTPALSQWSHWPALWRCINLIRLLTLGAGAYLSAIWLLGIRPRQFVIA
jgi:putative peptidoglycan lipid II flippase